MKRVVASLAVAFVVTGTYTAADVPRGTREGVAEFKRLDGTWRVVSSEKDGVEQPTDELPARLLLTFRAGSFERGGGPRGAISRIDATAAPKEVDYRHAGTEKDVLGIYLVEGDVFVECVGPPGEGRPKVFASIKGSGHTLTVYKRVKKKVD